MSSVEKSHEISAATEHCPNCGAALNNGSRQCEACGAMSVSSAPASTLPQAPVTVPPTQPPAPNRGRNPLALVVVAIVAAGMLYFGFHAARRPESEGAGIFKKSTPAPDFTLERLDGGGNMRLSDLRGKAVLLNFWATWCGPCKIETPWLVELQKQYGAQGLQVVGVAMDDSGREDIEKFAKEMGVNYPVLLGKEAVGEAYGGVPALPESFFIGRDGKIVDRIIGLKGRDEIEDSIKKALNTQSAAPTSTASAAPQN